MDTAIDISQFSAKECLRLYTKDSPKGCNLHLASSSYLWKTMIEELIGGRVRHHCVYCALPVSDSGYVL